VSIECRVNAEDPAAGFTPAPGRLDRFEPPGGPFVRVDTHACPGYLVPPHYDSMIAKVIVWAPNREAAIARMRRALGEFVIEGDRVRTTVGFLQTVLADPRFMAAQHSTRLVDELLGP
jgi:acetyl-CoA carboxylase biotin carboxylase subunit